MTTYHQLTYSIPLAPLNRTTLIQAHIAELAVVLGGRCIINYESQHLYNETLSLMVVKMIATIAHCDYIHTNMQRIIAEAVKLYSPDTSEIFVTDEPIMVRNFNCEDI